MIPSRPSAVRTWGFAALLSSLAGLAHGAPALAGGTCDPAWGPSFGGDPWTNGELLCVGTFDDGSGEALYAGGTFTRVGSVPATRFARWDGATWADVGGGLDNLPYAMCVFDDGSGPALFVGGLFGSAGGVPASRVARWDGTAWSALGTGVDAEVRAFVVHDDGSGPALYVGGDFTTAGGVAVGGVARWDGTSWSAPGSGANGEVHALAVYDEGAGARLFAGGFYTQAGGAPASFLARWDGAAWSAAGPGLNGGVHALQVFDDGGGAVLCAGGAFTTAGGAASRVAAWDGTTWSAFADGFDDRVRSFAVYDGGSGPELHAAGQFDQSGFTDVDGVARWDGTAWQPLPGGLGLDGWGLAVYDDGEDVGEALYMAGRQFLTIRGVTRWDGSEWSVPSAEGPSTAVWAVESFAGELHAGGSFEVAGAHLVEGLAKWTDDGWSPVPGAAFDGQIDALHVHDAGGGPALYAGGRFTDVGGVSANRLARFDGTSWTPLGIGLDDRCNALATFGSELYAGGLFSTANGVAAPVVASWDGSQFSSLGFEAGGQAFAMETYDDGSGPALFVGGRFLETGLTHTLARWDGTTLVYVPGSPTHTVPTVDAFASSLAVLDDGTGPKLYVGGFFDDAGGVPVGNVAAWDGTAWSPIPGVDATVTALAAFDDGLGSGLYVGGSFASAGGLPVEGLARWSGAVWSAVTGPGDADVTGLFGPFGGQALVATGLFDDGPGQASLARIASCLAFEPFCFGDGSGEACPCGNSGAPGHGCDLAQATGGIELGVEAFAPDLAGGGTAEFVSTGYPLAGTPGTLLIRSTAAQPTPVWFGDGLLCIDTVNFARINAALASGGTSLIPAMHGAGAGTFFYQVWARNTPITFCEPGSAFNLSNGVELTWP